VFDSDVFPAALDPNAEPLDGNCGSGGTVIDLSEHFRGTNPEHVETDASERPTADDRTDDLVTDVPPSPALTNLNDGSPPSIGTPSPSSFRERLERAILPSGGTEPPARSPSRLSSLTRSGSRTWGSVLGLSTLGQTELDAGDAVSSSLVFSSDPDPPVIAFIPTPRSWQEPESNLAQELQEQEAQSGDENV
jgi:hypothetical protein